MRGRLRRLQRNLGCRSGIVGGGGEIGLDSLGGRDRNAGGWFHHLPRFTLGRASIAGWNANLVPDADRSKTDRGILALLDKRVLTKRYGAMFLRSLPPAPLTQDSLRVRMFLET